MSTKPQTQASEPAAPPVAKIRVGLVTASIWARDTEKGRFYSVSFERRYRDKAGNWGTSHSYDEADVLALSKAADVAHTRILELRAADNADDEDGE